MIKPIVFDLNDLEASAINGSGFACYILARSYDSGENGAEQNFEKAVYWYQKGQELGNPCCIYGLGACYYFGDGIEKNLAKAYELFIQAYEKLLNLTETDSEPLIKCFARFCIGAYYYFGFGDIKKDPKKAFELIYECALEGHVAAIYDLGANFYYNGVGTKKDLELSKYYLELAASVELARAKRKLQEYECVYAKNQNKRNR